MINKYFFENLKEEGKRLGIPPGKNRALIREYLQTKIIYYLYKKKEVGYLSFIGGTSLRLLRGLNRFSEDLDFDNLGLNFQQIKTLFLDIKNKLKKEGIEADYRMKKTNNSGIGDFKFEKLLFDLGISSHKEEKLLIKINYTAPRVKSVTENVVLNRFGIVQNVVTNTVEFILSQKMRAILSRKETQPRDFYDAVWLMSRGVNPDKRLFSDMKIKNEKELFLKLKQVSSRKLKPNIEKFKKRLSPFLINEEEVDYLDNFEGVLESKL